MLRNRTRHTALVVFALVSGTIAFGQIGPTTINQEVVVISVDYEKKFINVRDLSTGREYGAQVEEKTKLKAKRKLLAGKKKPALEDFATGDQVRIKVLVERYGQTLKELTLVKKAASTS